MTWNIWGVFTLCVLGLLVCITACAWEYLNGRRVPLQLSALGAVLLVAVVFIGSLQVN